MTIALLLAGFIAGAIDAIAGGGGLITLPVLILYLGPGPTAIGSNKIAALTGTLISFILYAKKAFVPWKKALLFSAWVLIGSFIGSFLSRFIPKEYFRWFLVAICPVILILVWKKELWAKSQSEDHIPSTKEMFLKTTLSGLFCGLYDGAFGPGGGTFMFLCLLFIVKIPLFAALASSKLANLVSAGSSLAGYSVQGFVNVKAGFTLATGMAFGSYLGASLAVKGAEKVVRPALALVTLILLFKIITS